MFAAPYMSEQISSFWTFVNLNATFKKYLLRLHIDERMQNPNPVAFALQFFVALKLESGLLKFSVNFLQDTMELGSAMFTLSEAGKLNVVMSSVSQDPSLTKALSQMPECDVDKWTQTIASLSF